jgi:hypothetical protein
VEEKQDSQQPPAAELPAGRRKLTAEAERALAEAAERRKTGEDASRPKEIAGREGPEPTRYGDWEVKGIASDF